MKQRGEPDIIEDLMQRKLPVCEYFPANGQMNVSKGWLELYDFEKNGNTISISEWFQRIHSVDLSRFSKELKNFVLKPASVYETDIRYKQSGKELIWVHLSFEAIEKNENGGAKKIIGMHYLAADPKETENLLKPNEEQLNTIFNSISEAIISTDINGHIELMNHIAEFVTGWSIFESRGKHIREILNLVDAYTREKLPNPIDELCNNGILPDQSRQSVLVDRYGIEINVTFSITSIFNSNNSVTGYVLNIHDVTEEFNTRENLRVYKTLIASSVQGILMISLDGGIKYMNNALLAMLGENDAKQNDNLNFRTIYSKNSIEIINRKVRPALKENKSWSGELELLSKTGRRIPVISSFYELRDINEQLFMYAATIIDISERIAHEALLKENDELLENIINNLPLSVFLKEPEQLNTIKINKAYVNNTGFSEEQILNKNDYSLYSKKAADEYKKNDLQVFEKDTTIDIPEEEVQTPFGNKIFHTIKMPLHDVAGNVKYLLGISEDITERKKTEEIILASEKRFRDLFENSPLAYFALNNKGNIIDINPEFTQLVGYTFDEVNNRHFTDFVGVADKTFFFQLFDEFMRIGELNAECTIYGKKNNRIELIVVGRIQKNRNGTIERLHCVLYDFTERKQIETKLKEAKIAAESANKAKSAFLANMSHEIRTPMNAIIGFSEILIQQVKDNSQKAYLNSIMSSGKTLLSLINDILDLSIIESGKIKLRNDIVCIKNVFNDLKQFFAVASQQKGLNLYTEVSEHMPDFIEIDELRLRQILINLTNNAIKFTKDGYIRLTANVVKHNKEIDLVLSVEDTGIGIRESEQQKIFEAFSQADYYDSRRFEGTGLGLAITNKIVGLYKGKIDLHSKPTKGSTFIITLPGLKICHEAVHLDKENNFDPESIVFRKSSVLIVDDKDSNLSVAKGMLTQHNLELFFADNGNKAIDIASTVLPNLIFMDLRMPEMDGYKATEFLKSNEKTRHIPIIALTASVLGFNEKLLKDKNFSGYLPKPVEYQDLIIELSKFLPYDIKVKKEEKDVIKLPIEHIERDKKLFEYLEQQVYDAWDKLKTLRTSKLEKEFSKLIITTGEKFNNRYLKEKGKALESALNAFDIERIELIRGELNILFNKFKK